MACYFGHLKCIDLLVEYGADVNLGDRHYATPLHWCFFNDQPGSLKALLKHKPKTNGKHKWFAITPLEGCIKKDCHQVLETALRDPEVRALVGDDPFMTVTEDNVGRLVEAAIIHKAENCFRIIMDFY